MNERIRAAETVETLFELAIAGEKAAVDFYEGLAGKFSKEPDISEFWRNMAADERQHAAILEDILKSLAPVQRDALPDSYILRIARENAKIQMIDVLSLVRDLDDAYELAQIWENSEINRVFEFLATTFTSLDDRRTVVIRLIIDHLNKLAMFSRTFSEAEVRKGVKALDG